MTRLAWFAGLVLVLAGCEDDLTVPGGCPEFCPGGQPQIRDTILLANPGSDTSFFGYVGRDRVPSLLVSDGLQAGETRAWFRFPSRSDSVSVGSVRYTYTIDSIAVEVNLLARDSTLSDLTLYYYRLPISVDTLTTFDELDLLVIEPALVDSLQVPDSVRRGVLRKVFAGEALDRLVIPPADSGVLALGLRMRAAQPSGIRLSAAIGGAGPGFTTYVFADDADSTAQAIPLTALVNGYVRNNGDGPFDPDLLYLGWLPSARSFIRFTLPDSLLDRTIQVLRATLELTPAEPYAGLPGDPPQIEVRGLVRDLGAKSTPSLFVRSASTLPQEGGEILQVDVRGIVELWRLGIDFPSTFVAALSPEGASFHQPVFHSSRSAGGTPRLRITYLIPARVEQP
jgi:hypothetical protein